MIGVCESVHCQQLTKEELKKNSEILLKKHFDINSLSIDLMAGVVFQTHGHVFKRHDRTKEACGGPAICKVCESDLELLIKIIIYVRA